ncbi:ATP-binding cassette domain-containing protein [Vibrio fluvialis]|uniref:ATP-binding cassette domain-containing protein n=1 Tax=Vibrio fluvialis TaxID=676 RepID=UPI001F288152|nr:ATP-binding cassette domain-containing protein [Vibrio fluvialis]MCE7603755.1 ATP-binding cassette domain-containing protein [Vibrio fluvialis]
MPFLQASQISYQFDNGDTLFHSITCSMTQRRVGLVGRNGVGKSLLAELLSGERQPSTGSVALPNSVAIYRQLPSELLSGTRSIGEFLGKQAILDALKRIESGDCSQHWFDVVGDEWDLPAKLNQQLASMHLPQDPAFLCAKLSGGQLAQLQLWQLFHRSTQLLILDEPSNHLDTHAKQWLIETMRSFQGAILLISHDRQLLREMDEIWELSGLGLQVFGGNYDVYAEQKRSELLAVERQLACITKQQKQLEEQAQCNREKAEQRASQGNKLRREGSQATILLDGKKDKATARAANRSKNEQLRQSHLQAKAQSLSARKEQLKGQKLYLAGSLQNTGKAITITEAVLAFGNAKPKTFTVYAHEKVHLTGSNGCGKSTLLKTLLGDVPLPSGELQLNSALYYLDQHFGAVREDWSVLENLLQQCAGMKERDARTLLAGIGFRRDSVFRQGKSLSGGEKMKLTMLIASHQNAQPFLLLDEPDNHLDLDSKLMLAQALQQYQGGFMLISHDPTFAEESGVQREINWDAE